MSKFFNDREMARKAIALGIKHLGYTFPHYLWGDVENQVVTDWHMVADYFTA